MPRPHGARPVPDVIVRNRAPPLGCLRQLSGDKRGLLAFPQGGGAAGACDGLRARARGPGRGRLRDRDGRAARRRQPLAGHADHGAVEGPGQGRRAVEHVPARQRSRRRADEPGIRAAVRDHGPLAADGRGHELLGARHRQHGGAGTLRHARAQGALAQAAAGRPHPVGLRDDRAGGGVVGRHQHRMPHRPRRRRLRHQRPQVVDQRRARPALRGHDPDGQDRPAGRHLPPAVDDPGAHATRRA
jgi:hypothetical protein